MEHTSCTKNLLNTKNILGVYHALVNSHLNYGISVWGDSKTSYIKINLNYTKKSYKKHHQRNGKYNAHTGQSSKN